jgi:MOSC domain-containing protein YiiM
MKTMNELMATLPQQGVVEWIGLRPGRHESMTSVDSVTATIEDGLIGDRYHGRSGMRHATLIQAEHLDVIASCLGRHSVAPELLRRNIVVRGINLLALKAKRIQIGTTILEFTGKCHPCSFMEEQFGDGGFNAVRGHGGITTRVVTGGIISVGDPVTMLGDVVP